MLTPLETLGLIAAVFYLLAASSVASLVSVLLCSIAVAMSARQYVRRHLDAVALLKTLGATRGFTLSVSLLQLIIVALLASVVGSVIGSAASL